MHFTDEYWDFMVSLSETLLCNMRFDVSILRRMASFSVSAKNLQDFLEVSYGD